MSYYSASQLTTSEKVTLVTIDCVERVKIFSASGANWVKTVKHFVVGVKDNGVTISSWTFDPLTNILQITGGANPNTRNLSLTYRKFYSNAPAIQPYDLNTGTSVEWLPLINSVGSIGQQLDEENTGIVLESSSSVALINESGCFDSIFDTLIWENQAVKMYSWFRGQAITTALQIFEGVVASKAFTDQVVTFKVNDFVFRLKNALNLGLFSSLDGNILPAIVGTPKRRIYGQVDNVQCVSLDATLAGYNLTGTMAGTVATKVIAGTSTLFLTELSPGDEILFTFSGTNYKYAVDAITSNGALTLGKELDVSISGQTITVLPKAPYRAKNRTWQIAGHKLRNPLTTISAVVSNTAFTCASVLDFFAGDAILVNGIATTINRIVDSTIYTTTSVTPIPVAGNTIEKTPVQKVFFGNQQLFINRDYTITNGTSAANIIFNSLAEFNVTDEKSFAVNLSFTNGSTNVTTASTIDFTAILKPRDWIRSDLTTETTWYEILNVLPQQITLRTSFTGVTNTKAARYKSVTYMDENSLVTVNCLGMEYTGLWMKTASDCVRHMILNDANFSVVNESKFAQARSDCPYVISIVLPSSIGSPSPLIRDTISLINQSVFGSLYGDSSQNISYSVLNAVKPQVSIVYKDDDIISFSVNSNQNIINSVVLDYRPYVDVYSETDTFKTITQGSTFVDSYIGIQNALQATAYIYEDDKAAIIARRMALFNSLSSSSVTIKAKMNLAQIVVNDKVYLSLARLYKRYAGSAKEKMGTVTAVKRDGYNTEITVTDLGNIYNRIMSIAPSTTNVYASATNDEKLKYGFVLSTTTETPDVTSEVGLGSNILG